MSSHYPTPDTPSGAYRTTRRSGAAQYFERIGKASFWDFWDDYREVHFEWIFPECPGMAMLTLIGWQGEVEH